MASYDYSGGGKALNSANANRIGLIKFTIDLAAESARRVTAGLAPLAAGDVITFAQLPGAAIVLYAGIVTRRASTSTTSTLTMGSTGGAVLSIGGALNGKTLGVLAGTVTNGIVQPTDASPALTLTITAETAIANAGLYDVYAAVMDLG